jgi:acyl-CoA thioesterase FadM
MLETTVRSSHIDMFGHVNNVRKSVPMPEAMKIFRKVHNHA